MYNFYHPVVSVLAVLIAFYSCSPKDDGSLFSNPPILTSANPGFLVQFGANTKAATDGDNSALDYCRSVKVDASGNIFCAGWTLSSMAETNAGAQDAFVMKLNSKGQVVWVTQLGAETSAALGIDSTGVDVCKDLALDSAGNIYCGGNTGSDLGEENGGGYDVFVMKLNSDGDVIWITQLGAVTKANPDDPSTNNANTDLCEAITVDSSDNIYCAGYTNSHMSEANGGSHDAFVMKLNSDGDVLWHTQLGNVTKAAGGSGNNSLIDRCWGVAADSNGYVYCGGDTQSDMSETNGGGDVPSAAYDAFVMKLNAADGSLVWHTQFGDVTKANNGTGDNSGQEICRGVAVDNSGNVYCAGSTTGSMQETHAGGVNDAIVMKLNSEGVLQWMTQLGEVTKAPGGNNSHSDLCRAVAVDQDSNVYCAGDTMSSMSELNAGGNATFDAFVMKLNSSGGLVWHTQLGATTKGYEDADASLNEACRSVAVDGAGNVYCGGETKSSLGETKADSTGATSDVFILKLNSKGELN